MLIYWRGLTCFQIDSKKPQQEEVTFFINPFSELRGKSGSKTFRARVVALSGTGNEYLTDAQAFSNPFFIDIPGEYEIGEIFIDAISAPRKQDMASSHLIFYSEIEELRIAHLGLLDRNLNDHELSCLKNIDILFIPVGGGVAMTPEIATEVIGQIEPRVVIPMMYATPTFQNSLLPLNAFCKELGIICPQPQVSYKVGRKDLPEEEMQVVVLSPSV